MQHVPGGSTSCRTSSAWTPPSCAGGRRGISQWAEFQGPKFRVVLHNSNERMVILPVFFGVGTPHRNCLRRWRAIGCLGVVGMVRGPITKVEINLIVIIVNFVIIHVGISAVLIRLVMGILGHLHGIDRWRRSRWRLVWHRRGLGSWFVIIIAAWN